MGKLLPYAFKKTELLEQALSHCSVGSKNNERLEYLGDSILGFVVAATLYEKFPKASEGQLTRLRSQLVKGEKLAEIAHKIGLHEHIKVGKSESKSGSWNRDSVLADTLEAIFGAIYLDSNIKTCEKVILSMYGKCIKNISISDIKKDYKTNLQEYLQSRKQKAPLYKVINKKGEPHKPLFKVSCKIELLENSIFAEGASKRKAEQLAAKKILEILLELKKDDAI